MNENCKSKSIAKNKSKKKQIVQHREIEIRADKDGNLYRFANTQPGCRKFLEKMVTRSSGLKDILIQNVAEVDSETGAIIHLLIGRHDVQ